MKIEQFSHQQQFNVALVGGKISKFQNLVEILDFSFQCLSQLGISPHHLCPELIDFSALEKQKMKPKKSSFT